jgi:hypothetical protein
MGNSPTNNETQKMAPKKRLNLSKLNSKIDPETIRLVVPLLDKNMDKKKSPKKISRPNTVFCLPLLTLKTGILCEVVIDYRFFKINLTRLLFIDIHFFSKSMYTLSSQEKKSKTF